jgi:parallel beta-helix repeat protein
MDDQSKKAVTSSYTVHAPIVIYGNAGFTTPNGIQGGTGTITDPFIISGWDIVASAAHGISIWNTTAYFIIKDCYIHNGSASYDGIHLSNCCYGIMTNNTCSGNSYGIDLDSGCYINTLSDNTCSGNSYGIGLSNANSNVLSGNNCSKNGNYGIWILSDSNNIIINNTCSNNSNYGIVITSSNSNIFSNNAIFSNNLYGLTITNAGSSNNKIWNNTFYHNNGAGDSYNSSRIQGSDSGGNNRWNASGSPHGYGNWWSDWQNRDFNVDGIQDAPYNITGSAGAKDYYPLATNLLPLPDSTLPLIDITSPTSNPILLIGSSTVNLSGTASDNVGVMIVKWMNDATRENGTATGTTSWTITGITLIVGSNLIYVKAYDGRGNTATDTITVFRDIAAPTVTIASPTNLLTYNTTASTVNLGGTASDNAGVASVTWKNQATGVSGVASGTTSWSITSISLNTGNNLIYVNASDAVGNKATDSITVVRDDTGPTVTITSPTNDPAFSTNVAIISLGGTAADNSGVSIVNWSNIATGASGTATGTTSWTVAVITLNIGINKIYVNATDAFGNVGTNSLIVTYTQPTVLSVIGLASPTSGTIPLTVSFTCTPVGGESPYTYSWAFGDGGISTQQSPSHKYNSSGTFMATVTVTDNASHTAQWNTTITVTGSGIGDLLSGAMTLGIIVVGLIGTLIIVYLIPKWRKKDSEDKPGSPP